MILGVTGHRQLGGWTIPNPVYDYVLAETHIFLIERKPTKLITGMALGFDTLIAELAIKAGVPFIAAIPFIGQERLWAPDAQKHYHQLLEHAHSIEVVSPGGYASWKLHARNQWIVNHSDMMLAAFDSSQKGGTANCVAYATDKKKPTVIIDPRKALNA